MPVLLFESSSDSLAIVFYYSNSATKREETFRKAERTTKATSTTDGLLRFEIILNDICSFYISAIASNTIFVIIITSLSFFYTCVGGISAVQHHR